IPLLLRPRTRRLLANPPPHSPPSPLSSHVRHHGQPFHFLRPPHPPHRRSHRHRPIHRTPRPPRIFLLRNSSRQNHRIPRRIRKSPDLRRPFHPARSRRKRPKLHQPQHLHPRGTRTNLPRPRRLPLLQPLRHRN